MSVCPRDIGSMRTVRARHPRRGVMLGSKRVNKIAHALSHSGRGRGVRRRETVSVGHDRGRARGRHIYRDAAHGHAAHIAHKRPLRPRHACELSRGGAGGGTHSYPVREPRPMGLLWLAGWRTRLGRHPCIWAAPRHPCVTQMWRWEATRPGSGREEEGPIRRWRGMRRFALGEGGAA